MVASNNFLVRNKLVAWLLAIIVLHGGALTSQAQDRRAGRPAQPSTRPAAARGAAGELAAGFDKQAVPVGQLLPDVTVCDSSGKPFPIRQLRGHYSVLVFGCMT